LLTNDADAYSGLSIITMPKEAFGSVETRFPTSLSAPSSFNDAMSFSAKGTFEAGVIATTIPNSASPPTEELSLNLGDDRGQAAAA
jgi:hypothetical protein